MACRINRSPEPNEKPAPGAGFLLENGLAAAFDVEHRWRHANAPARYHAVWIGFEDHPRFAIDIRRDDKVRCALDILVGLLFEACLLYTSDAADE